MLYEGLGWGMMVYDGLSWFIMVYDDVWWLMNVYSIMLFDGLSFFMMMYDDVWWFIILHDDVSFIMHIHGWFFPCIFMVYHICHWYSWFIIVYHGVWWFMMFYDGVSSFILGNCHLVIFCIGPVWSCESKNGSFLDKNPYVYRLCMGVSKNRVPQMDGL